MWFVDRTPITVKAGDGGRGCAAFAQPPYTRYPYPDGGDGGDGGSVIVRADPNFSTLLDFHFRHEFLAGRGGHGGPNQKTGARGEDLVIRVPVGTVVQDEETGATLSDLTRIDQQVIVVKGGRGGLGNANRRSGGAARRSGSGLSARPGRPGRTPRGAVGPRARVATPGRLGEQRRIVLELKLIADIGLIGFPNAGKSSLLRRISTARPKVGAYPFTTRYPVLGVVEVDGERAFVACDIPGLIEGAHEGRGLGMQFLRHIERTRLLLHLVDMAAVDGRDPVRAFEQLNRELSAYSPALELKPQLIVANKMDLDSAKAYLATFRAALRGRPEQILPISCSTGAGIPGLLRAAWEALQRIPS